MGADADAVRIVAMLVHLRDSLTEISVMLTDYQANLDVVHDGPATRQTSEFLDGFLLATRIAKNQLES